jgi:hypothetical protein
MTLDERLKRARWYLQSVEAKSGSREIGPLRVAIADWVSLTQDVAAIGIELGRLLGERTEPESSAPASR